MASVPNFQARRMQVASKVEADEKAHRFWANPKAQLPPSDSWRKYVSEKICWRYYGG